MENFYGAIVEPDGRIRLKTSIHLERGLEVFVAVPGPVIDSVASGIALSEFSLSIDWLNQEEDQAWAHL
jgi:hypothetical protein